MSETNQTVRTTFVWDTASVDRGAQVVERAYDREKKVREAARRDMNHAGAGYAAGVRQNAGARLAGAGGGKGGHGSDSNFVAGIRDLAEGRSLNALTRFTQVAKLAGGSVAFAFAAYKTGKEAIKTVHDEMVETDKAATRLNANFIRVANAATFSNAGHGADALGEQAAALREQVAAENEQQVRLAKLRDLKDSNPAASALYRGMDWVRSRSLFGGAQTTEEKQRSSELQSQLASRQLSQINQRRSEAFGHGRDTAAERLDGSSFAAARMESQFQEKREVADAQRLGASEKDLSLIKEKFSIERERIDREQRAANIELGTQEKLIKARKEGLNEVAIAEIRLSEARHAANAAIGTEGRKAAAIRINEAEHSLHVAEREHAIRLQGLEVDRAVARFRGNADQAAVMAADAEQRNAASKLEALESSHDATEEQKKQARNDLDRANTARVLLERSQAVARIQARANDKSGAIGLRGAGAGLGVGSEPAQRAQLQAAEEIARVQRDAANESAEKERYSLQSIQAQHRAVEALAHAQLQLKRHVLETARVRRIEIENLRTGTTAIRLQNVGRGERGQLAISRQQSDLAQYEAHREQNPALAQEFADEQKERETGMYLQKYFRPDGRRRPRGQINREERLARRTQGRLERASARLDNNGGLIDVRRDIGGKIIGGTDPITREKLSAEQIYARKNAPADRAAKDKDEGQKVFTEIWKVLNERLPKTTN